MTITELKLELIKKVIHTDDFETLMKLEEILKNKSSIITIANEPSSVYQEKEEIRIFNDWQRARIDIALKQVENGEYITDEEAQIEIEKWFEEQER
ncbi:putative transcriptional regulator [Flavobacterium arsenatis]|uniref:Transcriptional regulator n=1 Tax=Flavobacterium arsenatis TaxID=1484332 RepID=A0ABU1TP95_9FLAO|nr:hypothetical protein [Flavobacterium arsenatis]MDR6967617.1 putative transcriptional regulator [Flavobacterium arsenatis]